MDKELAIKLVNRRLDSSTFRNAVLSNLFYDGKVLRDIVLDDGCVKEYTKDDLLGVEDLGDTYFDYLTYNPMRRNVKKKTNYLLAKPFTVIGKEEVRKFLYSNVRILTETVREIYKKGEVWWEFEPDSLSDLKFKITVRRAESTVPKYTNEEHTEYDAVGYLWNKIEDGKTKRYVDFVDLEGRHRFSLSTETSGDENLPHAKKNGEEKNFSQIPFIRLDGDGLYQQIKYLGVMYSNRYKQADKLLEDNADPVAVVQNADGTDDEEFVESIKQNKLVKVSGDGGFSYASKQSDYASLEAFMKVMKSDISDLCGVVARESELQYITSGRAIDRLYVDMDSDAAEMGEILRYAIMSFLQFVEKETGKVLLDDFGITFNTDKPTDETAVIQNINTSKEILSERTLLENHPWVKDVEEELERKKKEAQKKDTKQVEDKIKTGEEQVEESEDDGSSETDDT